MVLNRWRNTAWERKNTENLFRKLRRDYFERTSREIYRSRRKKTNIRNRPAAPRRCKRSTSRAGNGRLKMLFPSAPNLTK